MESISNKFIIRAQDKRYATITLRHIHVRRDFLTTHDIITSRMQVSTRACVTNDRLSLKKKVTTAVNSRQAPRVEADANIPFRLSAKYVAASELTENRWKISRVYPSCISLFLLFLLAVFARTIIRRRRRRNRRDRGFSRNRVRSQPRNPARPPTPFIASRSFNLPVRLELEWP